MPTVRVAAIQPHYQNMPESMSEEQIWTKNDLANLFDTYVKPQIALTLDLLEQAGRQQTDVVTTCEDLAGLGSLVYNPDNTLFRGLTELAEPYIEQEISQIAKAYNMYVLACYHKRADSRIFNVSTIFDRQGAIAGHYRKTHLPAYEKWACAEGDNLDVFDLDFGRIGIAVCYDMMFQEVVQVMAMRGARIIFHPTLGFNWNDSIGEATLRVRANDNGVFIVTAKNYGYNRAGHSSVIDDWGHVRSDAGFNSNVIVFADIDPSQTRAHPDLHMASMTAGDPDMQRVKEQERRPDLYSPITEDLTQRLQPLSPAERIIFFSNKKQGKYHW